MSKIPTFTPDQIAWLEACFPEKISLPADGSELYLRLGQRQVVTHIKASMAAKQRAIPKPE